MNITRGRVKKALKIVLYGPEGIGKSSLASRFPGAVFMDTEDSTAHMDVARFDKASSWEMLKQQAEWVKQHPSEVGTLILDTADWAERLEIEELCKRHGWDGLEAPGYGRGFQYSAEEFGRLLNIFQGCVNAGVNVVITAHAQLRKVELPEEMGAYDHWEMKTSKKVAPMIREWADAVFFLNYKTVIINVDGKGQTKGKNKAQGGRRVMYTTHTPFWDAKNRFGLSDELPLDYNEIAHIVPSNVTAAETAPAPEKFKGWPVHEKTWYKAGGKYYVYEKGDMIPPDIAKDGEPISEDEYKKAVEPAKTTRAAKKQEKKKEDTEEFTGWVASEKSWYRVGGEVFEFLKGEKIPPEVARDGKPISEDVYLGMIKNKAQEGVRTVDNGGYKEPDMRIPKKLRDLMIASKITEEEIKGLVGAKGYFPADMAVADYPADFVDGWCVGYWDQVKGAIMQIREKEMYELM